MYLLPTQTMTCGCSFAWGEYSNIPSKDSQVFKNTHKNFPRKLFLWKLFFFGGGGGEISGKEGLPNGILHKKRYIPSNDGWFMRMYCAQNSAFSKMQVVQLPCPTLQGRIKSTVWKYFKKNSKAIDHKTKHAAILTILLTINSLT